MARNLLLLVSLAVLLSLELLISSVFALTNPIDVTALQEFYKSLNNPPQLKGWKSSGGDPCGDESWTGISCLGTSVKLVKLHGLDLKGNFGHQLDNLYNLRELDLSSNYLYGEISSLLPPYITHLDLSCNNFSQSIPFSLATMKNLHYLNLSYNSLSGPVGNIFTDLKYLKAMDLSYNSLTGDLPSSFANLTNITELSLQNNQFTGSVTFLSNLPLTSLNIQNNHFSGVIPWQFQSLRNLWIGGNAFDPVAYYPPWGFPSNIVPSRHNTSSPPETPTNVVEYYPTNVRGHKHKRFGPGGTASIVVGVALVAICVAVVAAIRINKFLVHELETMESNDASPKNSASIDVDYSNEHGGIKMSPTGSPFMLMATPPRINSVFPPLTENANKRLSFSRTRRTPLMAKLFTVADLQSATNSFSENNLLGEGSLGSVYRGQFTNGKVLAVKIINMAVLSLQEEDQFLEVVWNVARLRHPNIVTLVGYSVEHGQHLLAYEYAGNTTLDHALHDYKGRHLSWRARIRIALGVARALVYLHSTCLPPVAHGNLKAANILLDDELMPYVSDCGLAVLRALTSNRVKLKASELAISCKGYAPPESSQPGMDKIKGDVYAFGVLLLELLTARRPFDRSRPKEERSLVKWASSHLHVYDSLEAMVDPTIKRTFSSRALSWFADIVSLCIQPEPEFRPTISEIVESLGRLNARCSVDGGRANSFELSFQTVDAAGLISSPATSYASI